MRIVEPKSTYKAQSNYAQGIVHAANAERMVVAGQLGLRPDGSLEDGLEKQMERAWTNVLGVMADAGFEARHLIKAVIYCTVPRQVALYREVRDRVLGGHLCACTYLEIAGLAAPEHLVEIEAEAIKDT
ncbi:MAG: RidA family protein [Rhodospirillaceae bacterium]